MARRMGILGTVSLHIKMGIDGRVHAITPVKGNAAPILVAASVKAAWLWRFKPALDRMRMPTECWIEIPVRFSLPGRQAHRRPDTRPAQASLQAHAVP
jgi:periplasmic protein TonB